MGEFDDLLPEFLQEAEDIFENLYQHLGELTPGPFPSEVMDAISRGVHTLKGGAGLFGFDQCKEKCHSLEDKINDLKKNSSDLNAEFISYLKREITEIQEALKVKRPTEEPKAVEPKAEDTKATAAKPAVEPDKAAAFVRVPLEKLDHTLSSIWELFLIRNRLTYLGETYKDVFSHNQTLLREWDQLTNALRISLGDLEQKAMSMRMVSLESLFNRMARVVEQYSAEKLKPIRFESEGGSTEVDKKVFDALAEPLIHLVRNAMDHGIESKEIREQQNKDTTGRITLTAKVVGNEVLISLGDDGKGLDANMLIESAQKKGLDTSHVKTPEDAYQLIFRPGFSTAAEVTDVSGRGVGMDAVKKSVEALGGEIFIETELHKGTRFTIKIPLSLSLLAATVCDINGTKYAMCSDDIVDARTVPFTTLKKNGETTTFPFRGELIPCYDLREFFPNPRHGFNLFQRSISVLTVRFKDKLCAVIVSGFVDNQELVTKPLPQLSPRIPYANGISILPTGKPIFILSLPKVCEAIQTDHLTRGISDERLVA